MNKDINNIMAYINSIDPYDMIKYNEYDIYSKEVKLIIAEKKLTPGKVKDIFFIGYKQYLSDDVAQKICYNINK